MLDVQKPNLSPTSHLSPTSPTMRKRQRTLDHVGNPAPVEGHAIPLSGPAAVGDDAFITDHDAVDSGADEEDDDEKPKDKKAGRRKIKIEYIQDKSRRHITFSKRKAGMLLFHKLLSTLLTCLFTGIMKKVTFIPDSYILFCLICPHRLTNCPLLREPRFSCSSYQRPVSSTPLPPPNSNPSLLNQRERISSKLVSMLPTALYHLHSQSVPNLVALRAQ